MPQISARQATRENFCAKYASNYYKLSLSIPLIDTVLSGMKRRFERNQKCVFEGLYIIPFIILASLKSNVSTSSKDHFKRVF